MKSIPTRSGAALAVLASALLATAAFAAQQAPAEMAEPAPAEGDKGDTKDTAETPEAKPVDERICRYIKLDMSSRRKTKVCRTTEEWRELGNPR